MVLLDIPLTLMLMSVGIVVLLILTGIITFIILWWKKYLEEKEKKLNELLDKILNDSMTGSENIEMIDRRIVLAFKDDELLKKHIEKRIVGQNGKKKNNILRKD